MRYSMQFENSTLSIIFRIGQVCFRVRGNFYDVINDSTLCHIKYFRALLSHWFYDSIYSLISFDFGVQVFRLFLVSLAFDSISCNRFHTSFVFFFVLNILSRAFRQNPIFHSVTFDAFVRLPCMNNVRDIISFIDV